MRISIVKSVALALGLATSAVSQTTDTMNINMNIAAEMTGPMMSSTLAPMKCKPFHFSHPSKQYRLTHSNRHGFVPRHARRYLHEDHPNASQHAELGAAAAVESNDSPGLQKSSTQ